MANGISKDELLTEEQLDSVAGGTTEEFEEIISAMSANRKLFSKLKEILSAQGENISLKDMKEPVAQILSGLGIDAKLNFDSSKNSYKDFKNGRLLSHNEVISKIKNY